MCQTWRIASWTVFSNNTTNIIQKRQKAGFSNGNRPSHKDYGIWSRLPLNWFLSTHTFIDWNCPGSVSVFKLYFWSFLPIHSIFKSGFFFLCQKKIFSLQEMDGLRVFRTTLWKTAIRMSLTWEFNITCFQGLNVKVWIKVLHLFFVRLRWKDIVLINESI